MGEEMGERKRQQAMHADDGLIGLPRRSGARPRIASSQITVRPVLSVEAVMEAARAFFQPDEAEEDDAVRAHENRRMRR